MTPNRIEWIILLYAAIVSLTSLHFPSASATNSRKEPHIFIHTVIYSKLKEWLGTMGPGALLTKEESVFHLYRPGRKTKDRTGATGSGSSAVTIIGELGHGDEDCLPPDEMVAIMRDKNKPAEAKKQLIEPRTCNIDEGLECVPIQKSGTSEKTYKCQCMLIYGPKGLYISYTNQEDGGTQYKCFLPAGLGDPSTCYGKDGFPLPFGESYNFEDPSNAKPPPNEEQVVIEYTSWNSIKPECVPHSVCKVGGTYIGKRCRCKPKFKLDKKEGGICSGTLQQVNINRLTLLMVSLISFMHIL